MNDAMTHPTVAAGADAAWARVGTIKAKVMATAGMILRMDNSPRTRPSGR